KHNQHSFPTRRSSDLGYSPIMMCESCGNSPTCVICDVSLTYHKFQKQLNCHYCGYHIKLPNTCPSCGDTNLHVKGFGTEKIEEEDRKSTRLNSSHVKI